MYWRRCGSMADEVVISTETIELEALLKWAGATRTGGQAKRWIQEGRVRVNGATERRRGRLLRPGDRVTIPGEVVLAVVHRRG